MKSNRLITLLVTLTLVMQGIILYRQTQVSTERRQKSEPVRDAPKNTFMHLEGLPVKGVNTARVILIEFSDYQCPYCERHAMGVGRQLDTEFVSTGAIRHAFVNNPLAIHRDARFLATAAICGGRQNRYWEMHDGLFNKKAKTRQEVMSIAEGLQLDSVPFQECIDGNAEAEKEIQRDVEIAQDFGLKVTPAFAIGQIDSSGRIHVQKFISGAVSFDVFKKAIDEILTKSINS